jgi:predicted amidohydrolase
MAPILKKYKAAAVNAEPGWFDLEESVRRTIHWIDEAGKAGCKFIAFPELCPSCSSAVLTTDLQGSLATPTGPGRSITRKAYL